MSRSLPPHSALRGQSNRGKKRLREKTGRPRCGQNRTECNFFGLAPLSPPCMRGDPGWCGLFSPRFGVGLNSARRRRAGSNKDARTVHSLREVDEGRVGALLELDGAAARVDRRPDVIPVQVRLPKKRGQATRRSRVSKPHSYARQYTATAEQCSTHAATSGLRKTRPPAFASS